MSNGQDRWTMTWYRNQSGESPIQRFLDSLQGRNKDEAATLLNLLREWGNQMRSPRSEPVGGGLFELRGHQVRIFYVFRPGRRIVVLDGMIKKQDKIPADVLKRVRVYQRDVETRDHAQREGRN